MQPTSGAARRPADRPDQSDSPSRGSTFGCASNGLSGGTTVPVITFPNVTTPRGRHLLSTRTRGLTDRGRATYQRTRLVERLRLRPASRRPQSEGGTVPAVVRVWGLTVILSLAAVAIYVTQLHGLPAYEAPINIPWPL